LEHVTNLELILSGATGVLTILLGLLVNAYLPSYVKKKAKNLATKEDVAEITSLVERVRSEVSNESVLLEKRREVYERISNSLRIFIAGHAASDNDKEQFHAAYAACWLWTPDHVLENLNKFIRMQQDIAANPSSHTQDDLKQLFGEITLTMRKDVGFPVTTMQQKSYMFVRF
jgi:hypothetical protein